MKKKILIFSDSHGKSKEVKNLLTTQKYDYVFFLGDGLRDVQDFNDVNVKKVAGNCDGFSDEAITQFINVGTSKIMITHGHEYRAKFTLLLLKECASNNNCDVVCYGHTHRQKVEYIDGVLFINPGAFKNGQYAYLTIDDNGTKKVETF